MDENLYEINKVYREERNLITIAEIESILEKYNIGKKSLSSLLGWKEVIQAMMDSNYADFLK